MSIGIALLVAGLTVVIAYGVAYVRGCSAGAATIADLAIAELQEQRRQGRHEMAELVMESYGPLLKQLEEFAGSVEEMGDQLAEEAERGVKERIKAMREASPWN